MELTAARRDGSHDFDFLFGEWTVRHRRLRRPLSGSAEWYEFDSTCRAWPLWNGKGNVDEFIGEMPSGPLEGGTLRLYDAASGKWSLFWATSKNGLVVIPNVGAFNDDGIGEFFSSEEFEGRPIICRYRWIPKTATACRWEQAFSVDGGATWEDNWIMEFTRKNLDCVD
jgi:hypothetical protein